MSDMTTDEQFIADVERAARAVRAAAAGASMNGIPDHVIARLVREGISGVQRLATTHHMRDRLEQLGYEPTGESITPPVIPEFTDVDPGHGQPGDWDYRPPQLHPMIGRRHAA